MNRNMVTAAGLLVAALGAGAATNGTIAIEEVRQMSLEQLLNVDVTSVSRTESTVGESPAAIFVITQDMIRRSGATTIPELFRMVPGMDVARLDGNKWMIASRGFNERFNGRMLVQMDGRTLYNPVFSGVYWDAVDYPLGDIERIEVIRGPGASVWGANAVNGIINIITKSAKDTQGGMLSLGGGSEELAFGEGRFGGKAGENLYYRIFGKSFNRDTQFSQAGDTHDAWRGEFGGARLDWTAQERDTFSLQGGFSRDVAGRKDLRPTTLTPFVFTNVEDEVTTAGHILGRWSHTTSKESGWAVQAYWDHMERDFQNLEFLLRWDTYDVDFQHNFALGQRQKIVYGAGYRRTEILMTDSFENGFAVQWDDNRQGLDLYSAFVQDQISVVEEKLSLTLGSKFEHNDFTGYEVQPSARLLWTPSKEQTVWAAVSRAVKTPDMTDNELRIRLLPSGTPPVFNSLTPNTDLETEKVIAYELGYRVQATRNLSVDLALFYNEYDDLRVFVAQPVVAEPAVAGASTRPLARGNALEAETYGAEVSATWQMLDWWRFRAAYSYIEIEVHRDPGVAATSEDGPEGNSPANQYYLQSSWDLPHDTEFDLIGRYVDSLSGFNPSAAPDGTTEAPDDIDNYFALDARFSFRPAKNLEVSIVGQNLLDAQHPEAGTSTLVRSPVIEIERSVYGKVSARW